MPDFSTILQTPTIRNVVQENLLERAFHDALFPRMLFRGEATPVPWPTGVGDTQIFSAPGLLDVDAQPLTPGEDPTPETYPVEQWEAQAQQYSKTIDTHMPTSISAIANLFLRNTHQLGMQAAQTLNRVVRNRMFNAALSGQSVLDGAAVGVATFRVQRLNGFTRARRPDLPAGSPVRFNPVSASNPLPVRIFDNGAEVTRNITAFNPDVAGDEQGPGTVTVDAALTNAADRAYILADDRSFLVRVGGGNSIDDLTASTDIPTLADVRTAVSNFWQQNVPEHPDGRFHCHVAPQSQALVFADPEFQRLLTALPDYYMYRQFALGELLNTVFLRNSESPVAETVVGGSTATFNVKDPFPGELFVGGTSAGARVFRMLFTAQAGIFEYYQDLMSLITEAGVTGQVGDPRIVNNGIDIFSDRIQLIIRGPLNRLQDQVTASWKFIGDWPTRTDVTTGNAARFKRFLAIEHTE